MTNETNTVRKPARLDIVDLPRDKDRVLGGLRQALCASFNYCRRYGRKLEVLRDTLTVILERINEQLEYNELEQAKVAKAKQASKQATQDASEDDSKVDNNTSVQTPSDGEKTAPVADTKASDTQNTKTPTQTPLTNKEAK